MKQVYKKWGLGLLAAGAAVVLLDALYLERYFFEVRRFSIGKRDSSKKIRLILLSDLHFRRRFYSYHRRLARKINSLAPDLILISGDLIDQTGTPGPARKFLSLLAPIIPKLAIPGNHDNKNRVSRGTLRRLLEQHNGRLLVNETVQLWLQGERFTITGLDDFIESEGRFAEAVKHTGREAHHLLLVHSPLQQEEVLEEIELLNAQRSPDRQLAIQYIFAGHNHGGQVRLGPVVPVLPEESGDYVNGWYNKEAPYLYVSKGFGVSAVPFRFGARSEVTLFEYGV